MASELQAMETPPSTNPHPPRKRKPKHGKKGKNPNKQLKPNQETSTKPRNPSQKMKKLFRKRAKAYNSDDDEEEISYEEDEEISQSSGEEGEESLDLGDEGDDEDEGHAGFRGVTKFNEGVRAFKVAFLKIMKKNLPNDDLLGPILSAHKRLVAEKLAEEEEEHKGKREAKKEKHLAGEKGHVKPESFLDTKEKFLISVATKGVVKLFNAVNKAQNAQKGLNPSRSKDAKELAKQRKQTFQSELKKSTTVALDNSLPFNSSKVLKSTDKENNDEPGWAPLRDSYMLTNSKLKDWDKMADPAAVVDQEKVPSGSSSDDD